MGEAATAIDSKFPGRVEGVNKKAYRPDGSELTDFDIALTDDIVIQVKEGGARRLKAQIMNSSAEMKQYGMKQEIIGYAPDLDLEKTFDLFYLICFIPLGGIVLFFLMLLPGTSGANRYGPSPRGAEEQNHSIVNRNLF